MGTAREQLLTLLREIAHVRGTVTLASGKESDFYIDCRKVSLHGQGMVLCGEVLHAAARELNLDIAGVGGPTLGADPLICAFTHAAYQAGAPMHAFIVRKEAKGHGEGRRIEGLTNLPAAARVLVLEDVVTTGASTVRALEACRAEGLVPVHVLAVVDRQEGGREAVEASGVPFSSLYDRGDFTGQDP